MADVYPYDIDSVATAPEYCHRCGAELGTRTFEGRECAWCPECELVLSRNPLAAVHVVVHDDDHVLLLDEPIPQHEGLLSLPGGHARHDEGPKPAVLRELAEETGLRADPADLSLLTVTHAEAEDVAFYFVTYELERTDASGELSPEAEGFEAAFVPTDDALSPNSRLRKNDRERIRLALDG